MENIALKEKNETKEICIKHMHRYVCVWTKDGSVYDGIVEHVDDENIYMAVPVGEENTNMQHANMQHHANIQPEVYPHYPDCGCGGMDTRALGYPAPFPGYGPGYGYGYGYSPYPFYGRRRFNRLVLPLALLTAISLLPYY